MAKYQIEITVAKTIFISDLSFEVSAWKIFEFLLIQHQFLSELNWIVTFTTTAVQLSYLEA